MTRDGGGWTLLGGGPCARDELWTRNAVGVVSDPAGDSPLLVKRLRGGRVLMAGDAHARIGDEARYGELYLGPPRRGIWFCLFFLIPVQ